jgi:hypothetical protein
MLVPAMNNDELFNEIIKDNKIVLRKALYHLKEVRREAIKKRDKELWKFFDYESKPNKNNWLILIGYNHGDPLILSAVRYLKEGKLNFFVEQSDNLALVSYTSHFLERYNERFLKQDKITKMDLFKQFIIYNTVSTIDIYPDSDSDKFRCFGRFKDGIGLGIFEDMGSRRIFFLKTYITTEMILKYQKNEFDSINEAFKEHRDAFYHK